LEFIVTRYEISSDRIREPITCALITDLHNKVYGSDNSRLIDSIRSESPDLILCAGDLIVGTNHNSHRTALDFATRLTEIAPVYYSNGNHETECRRYAKSKYAAYVTKLKRAGIHLLNNKCEDIVLGSTKIHIAGLEVSLEKYIKFRKPSCDISYIEDKVGKVPLDGSYTILMAHNPEFFATYGEWGADLTVSGHYHGGILRFPGLGGFISPKLRLFPDYSYGMYKNDKSVLYVTCGIGQHTLKLRLNNIPEIVNIRFAEKN
jgi:predicted MPP superfamily phosphohydrolase